MKDWRPTTDNSMLQARAALLQQIRLFFSERQVLEVDTPVLSLAAGTDPSLEPVRASLDHGDRREQEVFLQTSPEFAMKRLLAAGSGPIYQLAKVFRDGESGKKHNPEFTMLEWYHPDFTLSQLMDEVEALVSQVLNLKPAERLTYTDLFVRHLSIDPLSASLDDLRKLAREKIEVALDSDSRDHWLDLLFSHCIEPALQDPVFITHYPPSQAALARVEEDADGRETALRFELVTGGMELANGYQELTDVREQRNRFDRDLAQREEAGLPVYPVDERLLAALEHGLPDCAGVALGVDRLLMLLVGAEHISEVISFPVEIA